MKIFAIIFLEDGGSVQKEMLAEQLSSAATEAREWRSNYEAKSSKAVSALILKEFGGRRTILGDTPNKSLE